MMTRHDLQTHLVAAHCHLDRKGANHLIYRNPANGRCAAIPQHAQISDSVARAICDQLGILRP